MTPTRNADREPQLADILLKSQAALEEVRRYYKYERHAHVFPEKMYFLLSHCAHLLFSLWLTEQESPIGIFRSHSHMEALESELDFDVLRYVDYKRRTLHADTYEEHLKNEPDWFKFWLQALHVLDGDQPLDAEKFAQEILAYVNDKGFLEGTISKKRRKVFADLMRTDAGARLLHRSALILEAMTSAVALQFAHLDPGVNATEQIVALVCLLRQARLIIIHEVPASGPYVLFSGKGWGEPTWLRVHPGQVLGYLKVVPKRDGGGIVCTYKWTSGSQTKKKSWTQPTSTMPHSYEEALFRTWSRDVADERSCWLVQRAEAVRLKAIFRHIKAIQTSLSSNPLCAGLIGDLTDIWIDRHMRQEASQLEWNYVGKLDQLLAKLQSAYREAQILGGKNPGQEIIASMWPVRRSDHGEVEPSELPLSRPLKTRSRPRSVQWTERAPVEGHASPEQGTTTQQSPDDAAVHVTVPSNGGSNTAQTSMPPSVSPAAQNPKNADADPVHTPYSESEPSNGSTSNPAEASLSAIPPRDEQPGVDSCPAEEPTQEPPSVQPARETQTLLEARQDDDQTQNAPIPCQADVPQPGTNLLEDSTLVDATINAKTNPQEEKPHNALSEPKRTTTVFDLALRHDVALKAQPSQEEHRESHKSQLGNGEETIQAPAATGQQPLEPYQTYFKKIAAAVTAASGSAPESHSPRARSAMPRTRTASTAEQITTCRELLAVLMEHHGIPGNGQPLSRQRIQEELGWKASEVQRTMTDIFGNRPFGVYKQKCSEGIIGDFLKTWAQDRLDGQQGVPVRPTLQCV